MDEMQVARVAAIFFATLWTLLLGLQMVSGL
jgi:hypothetical protein